MIDARWLNLSLDLGFLLGFALADLGDTGPEESARYWLFCVGEVHGYLFAASSSGYDLLLTYRLSPNADGFAEDWSFSLVAVLWLAFDSAILLLIWLPSWNYSTCILCILSNVASTSCPEIHWRDSAIFGSCIWFCDYFWPSRYLTAAGYIFRINSESPSFGAVGLRLTKDLGISTLSNMRYARCLRAWAAATSLNGFWSCWHITDFWGHNSHSSALTSRIHRRQTSQQDHLTLHSKCTWSHPVLLSFLYFYSAVALWA